MSLLVEIEKQLGNFHLNVRFQAETETLALLGASGCGKSMTLKCIAGIMTPDRGRIVLNGRVLFDSEARIALPPQQRRVGYLFQNYALFPTMTVEKNILCGIRSGSKAEKNAALPATLHHFRLEGLEKRYPAQLSSGQQQRVALARILCSQPEVILLDEPFSALDSYLKWDLELKLSDFLENFSGPILWVSHDRGEVFRNCKRVCVLDQGASQGTFTLRQLFHEPETEAAARLSGCKNIVEAVPAGSAVTLPLSGSGEEAPLSELVDAFFLTEGFSHDWLLPNYILDHPAEDMTALPALLDDRTDAEARELCAVLGRCLRDADYWDWTPETLAETLGSYGAYLDA